MNPFIDWDYWSNVLTNVSLTSVKNNQMTFSWSVDLPFFNLYDAMHYSINSSNCGECSNNIIHNNSVTCIDYPQLSQSKSCLLMIDNIPVCVRHSSVTFKVKGV